MSVFHYEKDADGIVTVTMDMTGPVNAMNEEYRTAMRATVERLEDEDGLTGVVIASAKKVFFAGGDLHELLSVAPGDEARFFELVEGVKGDLRRLEKLPVPVAAAINGAALGGGLEICLACNHRVAWNDRSVQLGLPEVSLGLLPGAGGVVRMVNLLGLEKALPYLLEGKRIGPAQALEAGMIHATVESAEQLVPAARAWIRDSAGDAAAAVQPWDRKGHRVPGGSANSPKLAQLIGGAPAMLRKKTRGLLPAPEKILDCAVEAARIDFDAALRVESRGMTSLVTTPVAKNMITAFFFQMNQVSGGASRPRDVPPHKVRKVGILGAGMMGQGIAYVSAMAGIEVVLKDVSLEAAEKGRAYSANLLDKRIRRGRMDEAHKRDVLGMIKPTADDADLAGCDLIIEAVFEDMALKHKITRETERHLAKNGVWGTNTSSLPITKLAEASGHPENFIGIHFFSPVDKMKLVEIICGERTSDETLARAFDYTQQIRKLPIVVNDSLAFFTSRVFSSYLDEGVNLLHEGVHPVRIDNLGKATGMPVGPLAVHDEVSLKLSKTIATTWEAMGELDKWGDGRVMRSVVSTLIDDHGRGGRHYDGGFYDYHADGRKNVWPGLLDLYYKPRVEIADEDVKDRLIFRQVIETLKCLETGVLRTVADGNIGSIFAIGAPVHTGGFIQFVNGYGLQNFVDRCAELASAYGERFAVPEIVGRKLAAGETFG